MLACICAAIMCAAMMCPAAIVLQCSPAHRGQTPFVHQGSGFHFSLGIQLYRSARMTAYSTPARESFPDADKLLVAVPVAPQQADDLTAAQVRMEVHHEMHLNAPAVAAQHATFKF